MASMKKLLLSLIICVSAFQSACPMDLREGALWTGVGALGALAVDKIAPKLDETGKDRGLSVPLWLSSMGVSAAITYRFFTDENQKAQCLYFYLAMGAGGVLSLRAKEYKNYKKELQKKIDLRQQAQLKEQRIASFGENCRTGNVTLESIRNLVQDGLINIDLALSKLVEHRRWNIAQDLIIKDGAHFRLGDLIVQGAPLETVRSALGRIHRDDHPMYALYKAINAEVSFDIIQLLVGHGADLNKNNKHYDGPLDAAIGKKNTKIVRLLLEHGVNPNRTFDNVAPLSSAIRDEAPFEIIQLLVDHGADPYIEDCFGSSLELASRKNDKQVFAYLLDHTNALRYLRNNLSLDCISYMLKNFPEKIKKFNFAHHLLFKSEDARRKFVPGIFTFDGNSKDVLGYTDVYEAIDIESKRIQLALRLEPKNPHINECLITLRLLIGYVTGSITTPARMLSFIYERIGTTLPHLDNSDEWNDLVADNNLFNVLAESAKRGYFSFLMNNYDSFRRNEKLHRMIVTTGCDSSGKTILDYAAEHGLLGGKPEEIKQIID